MGLVYSTDKGRVCPSCGQAQADCRCKALAALRPLGDGVIRQWLMADIAPTLRYKTLIVWDRLNHIVRIMYVSNRSTDGGIDSSVVYHPKTQRWGRDDNRAQALRSASATGSGRKPGLAASKPSATASFSRDSMEQVT